MTREATSAPAYQSLKFTDFDRCCDALSSFDWSPVQLSSGALNLSYDAFAVEEFGAFRLGFEPRVYDYSIIQPGTVAFSLAFGPMTFGGIDASQGTLGIMLDTRGYRSTFEPGFVCYEFYCSREMLQRHPLGDQILNPKRQFPDLVFQPDSVSAYRLRNILSDLISGDGLFLGPSARDATGTAVLNQLYRMIAPRIGALGESRHSFRKPSDLALSALELLEREDLTSEVTSLTTALGVTRRALEKSFKSTLGVSPGQFLLARRLTRVREDLANGRGRVGDLAHIAGFEHLGRFARQYRRLFDELPSETLARATT